MTRYLRRSWRLVLTLLAGITAYFLVVVFAEAFTDRDWRLSGLEWPDDFIAAAVLVCLVPIALELSAFWWLRHNPYARAVARNIPGLSRAYHTTLDWTTAHRGVATIDYPRTRIRIRADTQEIVKSRLFPVTKEPWTADWIEQNLRAGDVLYDIGANVGVYSLIAVKASGGDAAVVAFEPAYATFASLCENLLMNDAADFVTPLPVVLGDRTRMGRLGYEATAAGAAMHILDGEGTGVYRQPVLVYSLDQLIELSGLAAPTLIKLDVDGAETAVLAGARSTLRRPELRSLVIEVDCRATHDVLRELNDAGFQLERRIEDRGGVPLSGIWYGIFERA